MRNSSIFVDGGAGGGKALLFSLWSLAEALNRPLGLFLRRAVGVSAVTDASILFAVCIL